MLHVLDKMGHHSIHHLNFHQRHRRREGRAIGVKFCLFLHIYFIICFLKSAIFLKLDGLESLACPQEAEFFFYYFFLNIFLKKRLGGTVSSSSGVRSLGLLWSINDKERIRPTRWTRGSSVELVGMVGLVRGRPFGF